MSRINWKALIVIASIVTILFIWFKCEKNKPEHKPVNIKQIHEKSDSNTAIYKELSVLRDSIKIEQKIIEIQSELITRRSKELARIKDLYLKVHLLKPDISQFEKHSQAYIDSLNDVAQEKEMLLERANDNNGKLVKTIQIGDSIDNIKDSLYYANTLHLNTAVDSLKNEGKRNQKKAYWTGVRHGVVAGLAIGGIVGVGISK